MTHANLLWQFWMRIQHSWSWKIPNLSPTFSMTNKSNWSSSSNLKRKKMFLLTWLDLWMNWIFLFWIRKNLLKMVKKIGTKLSYHQMGLYKWIKMMWRASVLQLKLKRKHNSWRNLFILLWLFPRNMPIFISKTVHLTTRL